SALLLWDRQRRHTVAGQIGCPAIGSGDYPDAFFVTRHRVFPLRGVRTITRDNGPVISERFGVDIATNQHRFNRQDHTGLDSWAAHARAVVEDIRSLVHGRTDTVADVVFQDS